MGERLEIQDVALRDGIQMEPEFIPTGDKMRLAAALVEAGVRRMELSSFVSPRAMPQMADASELFLTGEHSDVIIRLGEPSHGRERVRSRRYSRFCWSNQR